MQKTKSLSHINGKAWSVSHSHKMQAILLDPFLIFASLFHSCVYFVLCCCKQVLSIWRERWPWASPDFQLLCLAEFKENLCLTKPTYNSQDKISVTLVGSCILSWTNHQGWRNGDQCLFEQAWVRAVHPCDPGSTGCYEKVIQLLQRKNFWSWLIN